MRRGPAIAATTIHVAFAGLAALLLVAAAGPLATDDLWWHLSLGRLYAESGPWLAADPRLHTAVGAPHPNAWLFDLALHGVASIGGLDALRGLHAALVASVLALAWRLLRRVSGDAALASLATGAFAVLAAYRLLQLRPSLATMLATLFLLGLLLDLRRGPRLVPMVLTGIVCALWANLHPGFVLGPVLLLAAASGRLLGLLLVAQTHARDARRAALGLALAGALGLVATGLNPEGFAAHLAYLDAGTSAAGEALVVDEWRGFPAFARPLPNLPPTPAAWATFWLLLLATPTATGLVLVRLWKGEGLRPPDGSLDGDAPATPLAARDDGAGRAARSQRPDSVLIALAGVGLLAPFVAIRFLWLSILPLMLLASLAAGASLRSGARDRPPCRGASPGRTLLAPLAALALLVALPTASAWRILAPRLERDVYRAPYDADRYYAHAVWFLADTGVEGRLFHPYFMGGFLEYWLSPRLETMVDGSLNFPRAVLDDYARIQTLVADTGTPDPRALLDRYGIDLFVGVGLPIEPRPGRPWRYTTSHLARSPDWLLVYRGLRSAVYLRRGPRNEANLERIAAWYARAGVPFDRETGFDVEAVLERSVGWAIEHGVAPIDHPHLVRAAERAAPRRRAIAHQRLAWTLATLGLHERALAVDARELPASASPALAESRARRRLWGLIGLDRRDALRASADEWSIDPGAGADARLARALAGFAEAARLYASMEDPDARDRLAATWTPLTDVEGGQLRSVERRAPARASRPGDEAPHSGSQWSRSPTPAR